MRPIGYVGQLMPREVVLALQRRIANVTDEPPLDGVRYHVLLNQSPIRIGHLAFRTAVQRRAVQRFRLANFAGLRARFLLLDDGFLVGRNDDAPQTRRNANTEDMLVLALIATARAEIHENNARAFTHTPPDATHTPALSQTRTHIQWWA